MKKKVLIIGNSAKEYAFAKYLSEKNEVYVAPGSSTIDEFATSVDIREDSVSELLEFAMETGIDLTIPVSLKSLDSNIVEVFNKNQLQIFAPARDMLKVLFDKPAMKRLFYKLRIPTPRFGIFEKQNMAMDYIKNLKNPFVVKTNEPSSAIAIASQKIVKNVLDFYFLNKSQKVLIEDYVWGTPFSYYVITDGYKALPIGSSIMYRYMLEGDGGQLTSGMGANIPNYKLSFDNESFIMDNVVYPLLEYFGNGQEPYIGVLGVDGILTNEGEIQVLGVQPFLQDADCTAILKVLDIDFIDLLQACLVGSFSDEFEEIPQKELSSTSIVLYCKNKENFENSIEGLKFLDDSIEVDFYPSVRKNRYLEYEVGVGPVMVLTSFARTVSSSVAKVYSEAENLNFKGIYYRKDVCKSAREML